MRTTYDFAIDLGTTNSVLTVCNQGRVEVVKLEFNSDVTPSAVYVESPGNVIVGRDALPAERGFTNPGRSVREFKREMGSSRPIHNFPLPRLQGDRDWTAQDLATEVLRYIRQCYKSQSGEEMQYAVITVPVDFAGAADEATRKAAQAAGFTDVRLEQEPAMAAYGYLNHPAIRGQIAQQPGAWLVYDLGGGTFDVALLEVYPGEKPRVLDHDGNRELGGKNFDTLICNLLVQHVLEQLPQCEQDERFPELKARLLHLAEEAKIRLSRNKRNAEGKVQIDRIPLQIREQLGLAGFDVSTDFRNYTLTYEQLSALVQDRVRLSLEICQGLLQKHGFTFEQIKKVLLIGGPTDALYLREALAAAFPGDGRVNSIHPFTMVAEGAALYAQSVPIKTDQVSERYQIDWKMGRMVNSPNVVVRGTLKSPSNNGSRGSLTLQFQNSSGVVLELAVSPEVEFSDRLSLHEGPNHFALRLLTSNGDPVEIDERSRELEIVYDPVFVDTTQTFPHTVGLEIADNRMSPIFRRGDQRSETEIKLKLKTKREAKKGERIDFILRAGELTSARRNPEIGRVSIEAPCALKKDAELDLIVKPLGATSFQLKARVAQVPISFDRKGEAATTIALADQPLPDIDDLLQSFNDVGEAVKRSQEKRNGILSKLEQKMSELSDFARQNDGAWNFELAQRHLAAIDDPSLKSRVELLKAELDEIEKSREEVRIRLLESDSGRSVRGAPPEVRKWADRTLAELLAKCDDIEIALNWIDSKDSSGKEHGELKAVFERFVVCAWAFYSCNQPGQVNATPEELQQWLQIWKKIQTAVREHDEHLDEYDREMDQLYWQVSRRSVAFVTAQYQHRNEQLYAKGDLVDKPMSRATWEKIRQTVGPAGTITRQNVNQVGRMLDEFDPYYYSEGGGGVSFRQEVGLPRPADGVILVPSEK